MNGLGRTPRAVGRLSSLLILAIAITSIVGCAEHEILEKHASNMVTDFAELEFVQVSVNEEDQQTLTIRNLGEGDLEISQITLVEETLDDPGGEEFRTGPGWVSDAVLATDESLELTVVYSPRDERADRGYIEIASNDPDEGNIRVALRTPELSPRIDSSKTVRFPRVPIVTDATRNKVFDIVHVQNAGHAPLEIRDIVLTPSNGDFHVTFPTSPDAEPSTDAPQWPNLVAPQESFPIRIFFNPQNDLPTSAELIVYTNDPLAPEHVIAIEGNSGSPCLRVSDEGGIDFGQGQVGESTPRTVTLENCSPSENLQIRDIAVCTTQGAACEADGEIFALDPASLPGELPEEPVVIGPQDSVSFGVTYTPQDDSVSRGELTIESNDPAKELVSVPLRGSGSVNQCPTAVADARLAGTSRYQTGIHTTPLATVELRGTSSYDPDGTVARYEWSIIDRPVNSNAELQPSASSAEPQLFLDLAGDYRVELKVYDEDGLASCGDPAIVTLTATPDEDIHVQLVWETPGDQNLSDGFGSDLDLHFLHPSGEWNSAPYDIFWNNPTAEWGVPGEEDNPTLDIDDTDGAGPENINLSSPEHGLTYSVGVFYYTDNDFGPSYATVRIYIGGQQQFEGRGKQLNATGDFWHVGDIAWPSAQIFSRDTVEADFPIGN